MPHSSGQPRADRSIIPNTLLSIHLDRKIEKKTRAATHLTTPSSRVPSAPSSTKTAIASSPAISPISCQLSDLLARFYSFSKPDILELDRAVKEFSERVPELALGPTTSTSASSVATPSQSPTLRHRLHSAAVTRYGPAVPDMECAIPVGQRLTLRRTLSPPLDRTSLLQEAAKARRNPQPRTVYLEIMAPPNSTNFSSYLEFSSAKQILFRPVCRKMIEECQISSGSSEMLL